jgi:two-component system response regulator RegA
MNGGQGTTTISQPGGTVLLVDDEEATRRKISILFRGAGCHVLSASNVHDTAVAIGAAKPERAIIEQRLPDGSGLLLLRELKQGFPGIRVVVLTRFPSLVGAVWAMRYGAANYVPKPAADATVLAAFDLNEAPPVREEKAHPLSLVEMQRELISQTLMECDGNISRTARRLGIDVRGLRRKLMTGKSTC